MGAEQQQVLQFCALSFGERKTHLRLRVGLLRQAERQGRQAPHGREQGLAEDRLQLACWTDCQQLQLAVLVEHNIHAARSPDAPAGAALDNPTGYARGGQP
jgi:hypothetical protein